MWGVALSSTCRSTNERENRQTEQTQQHYEKPLPNYQPPKRSTTNKHQRLLLLVSALLYVVYASLLGEGLVPEGYADFLSLLSFLVLSLLVPSYWLDALRGPGVMAV